MLRFLIGGAFTALLELYFKSNLYLPRLSALPHLPSIVRPRWTEASLGARWAARFVLMQCVCGSAGWVGTAASRRVLTLTSLEQEKNSI